MRLKQTADCQTREFCMVFEPGELEDMRSGYAGVKFQPHGGSVTVFRQDGGLWQVGTVELTGWCRKKDGSVGNREARTRVFASDGYPEAVVALLRELNG